MMSRILLADDSPPALRLAEQILSCQGMEVVSVADGAAALQQLTSVSPDLVIVDIQLAGKNAFEVARFMRNEPDFRDTPIIFAAAHADQFDEQDAKEAGADLIMHKPFEASALLGAVHYLLERKSSARSAEKLAASGIDRHSVRAAVTLALDSAMPALIEELTQRVLLALSSRG